MSLTPEDVERKAFKERFKGYDMDEVDAFLDQVAGRLQELVAERDDVRRRLHEAEQSSGESGDLLQRTLLTAQRTADETVAAAEAEAEQLRKEAQAEHERLLAEAREAAAAERRRLEAEGERLSRALEDLKAFRTEYLERVRRLVEEQFAALERVAVLPEIPDEMEELARSLADVYEAQAPGQAPVVDPPPDGPAGESALDTGLGEQSGGDAPRADE